MLCGKSRAFGRSPRVAEAAGTGAGGHLGDGQGERPDAIGGTGHGIGYGNAYTTEGIAKSIAVESDTCSNTTGGIEDPSGNHLSVQTRGVLPSDPDHEYSLGSTSGIPHLSDGTAHVAKIAYEGEMLEVYMDDLGDPALTVGVDLSSLLVLEGGRLIPGGPFSFALLDGVC
jgi:hypothetical protein